MSFYLKNINDIFILDSSGKLGINKSPQSELDIFGNFYSEKFLGLKTNFYGYKINCLSGVDASIFQYQTLKINTLISQSIESTVEASGYNVSGLNYSGKYFDLLGVLDAVSINTNNSNSYSVEGNISGKNLSGIYIKLNTTGNNRILGPSEAFKINSGIKTQTGYFSQDELYNFLVNYNNLPDDKTFASGQGTGDYWFDKVWIDKFLNLASGFNNEIISGHNSDRAGTIKYLAVPKTIKFFLCKCAGAGGEGDKTLAGCRQNMNPTICWSDCIQNSNDLGDCRYLLDTGINVFNISSSRPSFANVNQSKTKFINSFFNIENTLIFEKEFYEPYQYLAPAITFSSQDRETSRIIAENIVWMESFTGKIQFHCYGSGCLTYNFPGSYDIGLATKPLHKLSYITIA